MEIKKITVGELQTNCYFLVDSGEVAIVDPGDEADKIISEIEKLGVKITFIINTHNHFDHIGANRELKEKFGVKILIHKSDAGGEVLADGFLKQGDILNIGKSSVKVVETPGHTLGSICLFGDGFVISGDTLFEEGFGRTDLVGGSNKDMAASLRKLDQLIPEGAMVYPGHGNEFCYKKGMAIAWLDYLD